MPHAFGAIHAQCPWWYSWKHLDTVNSQDDSGLYEETAQAERDLLSRWEDDRAIRLLV